MAALGSFLAALQRCPAELEPLLLADLTWLGEARAAVGQLAAELCRRRDGAQASLATLLCLLRAQSCGRRQAAAFSEAHVACVEMLLEAEPLKRTPCEEWRLLSVEDDDLEACKALYGEESVSTPPDRVEVLVEDLCVVYRLKNRACSRVEARSQGRASTGDEAVANAAYELLQSFRGGALSLMEATELARQTRHACVPTADGPLLLAQPSCWLGLRSETTSMELQAFQATQVAREAARLVHQLLEQHAIFRPAGEPETVVNGQLAERFASKLADLRTSRGLQTPTLVFHGAPSQEVLRSICRRGFLLPGDWIEGTPDYLEQAHGNVKGFGVYTSPCLETAAKYSGSDADGSGLLLVALAAPGRCWLERSSSETQEMIAEWFFPKQPQVGQAYKGWVWKGDGWHPSAEQHRDQLDMAFAPCEGLYDGRFHSRLFGHGTKVSEELVLASVEQLLPLLLLPFGRRGGGYVAPAPALPGMGPFQRRRRVLCGSNVYRYPSDPPPERALTCCRLADDLWAIQVPGTPHRGTLTLGIFLVDPSLAADVHSQVAELLAALSGEMQASAFCSFDGAAKGCVPFLASETFLATFNSKWPLKQGEGDLATALEGAIDLAINKVVKEAERHLHASADPWRQLHVGQRLQSKSRRCEVLEVTFDLEQPRSLKVRWEDHLSEQIQSSTKLSTAFENQETLLRVDFGEGKIHYFPVTRKASPDGPTLRFVLFILSPFMASPSTRTRLERVVETRSAQLRCIGCEICLLPLVLGTGGERLAAWLAQNVSSDYAWWRPFYQASGGVPQLLEALGEDLRAWKATEASATLCVGGRAAVVRQGFLESPKSCGWRVRGEPGQCVLYEGQLPARDFWMEEEEYRTVVVEPSPKGDWTLVEVAEALEKFAQQLRGSCLANGPRALAHWAPRLRAAVERLGLPDETLTTTARLPPLERAAVAEKLRAITHSLQGTARALDEAVELGKAAQEEPSDAAWLRRAAQMKYGAQVLQRARKHMAADQSELWRQQLEALAHLAVPSEGGQRSSLSGRSCLEHLTELQRLAPGPLRQLPPAQALHVAGAVGCWLRLRRSDASEVEPWLTVLEHVSTAWGDTANAALALDAGLVLRDEDQEVITDVAVLSFEPRELHHWFVTSELYKCYLGMVFTRNPLGQVPGQSLALPALVWVKSAELLIGRAKPGEMSSEDADWLGAMLETHLSAMHTVQRMVQGGLEQLGSKLQGPELTTALTEAQGGPASVCCALAACCFAAPQLWGPQALRLARSRSLQRAASRTLPDTAPAENAAWPRRLRHVALALLAEAVSRACRRLVRATCRDQSEAQVLRQLLWSALGIEESSIVPVRPGNEPEPPDLQKPESHSDECDVAHVQRRSAQLFAPQGKYYQVGLTNCTPQGVVGCLMLRMAVLQHGEAQPGLMERLRGQLWARELSMKGFVEAALPGEVAPKAIQAALYAQGLRYHSAKQRCGRLESLERPEQVLRALAREQRHGAYLERLREKLRQQGSGALKALRSSKRQQELMSFAPCYAGLPKLFTAKEVSDLNAERDREDQLELLPTGLLKHHCCFPQCPLFLQDLRDAKDRLADASNATAWRRHGLYRHLAPMTWPEASLEDGYIPQLHAASSGRCVAKALGQLSRRLEGRSDAKEVLGSRFLQDALESLCAK